MDSHTHQSPFSFRSASFTSAEKNPQFKSTEIKSNFLRRIQNTMDKNFKKSISLNIKDFSNLKIFWRLDLSFDYCIEPKKMILIN